MKRIGELTMQVELLEAKTGVNFLPMPVESLQCHTMPN